MNQMKDQRPQTKFIKKASRELERGLGWQNVFAALM